ncbi:MAG: pyridoxamine 5'-phosphate oxidase family protein [Phycisphaerales bacterium]|nr:pyridoxamine 5'-phosphate oxidase family protein [Phycisphaerales bacterium]MCI0675831.1 pyridoxamine 5'-phosphate oxidase family protein [Phycisphaerales bacterium]
MILQQSAELTGYEALLDGVWTRLKRAADDPSSPFHLMSVATSNSDGRPCNRTLVLRGADRDLGLIWFHTDRRSPKLVHLKANPYVSALAYDPYDRVQIRLDGEVTLHQADSFAQRHWEQVSLAVRGAYGLSQGPGDPVEQADPRAQLMSQQFRSGQSETGWYNFTVIEVAVNVIDWLQIAHAGQRRAVLRAETGWKVEPVMP